MLTDRLYIEYKGFSDISRELGTLEQFFLGNESIVPGTVNYIGTPLE